MAYKFTSGQNQSVFKLDNFLGVDLTNSESEVELNRSPDALNLIMNQGGNLEKRRGIKLLVSFPDPVIWIYTAKVKTSSNTIIDVLLCQSNNRLKYFATDGALIRPFEQSSYTDITGLTSLSATVPVDLVPLDADGIYYLITSGGLAKPTLLKLDFVNEETGTPSIIDLSDTTLANYDSLIKTPITHIGRSPDGLTTTLFEQKNVLSKYQENTFLADGLSAAFVCSDTIDSANTKVWVKVAGAWVLKTVTTHYTVNTSTKTITFTSGNIPAIPTIDGEDNVKVRFLNDKINLEVGYNSTVHGLYGFGGLRNYMFLSGYETTTKSLIPMEYWGLRQLPLYLGENNTTTFPNKVIGYNNFGSYQTVHCDKLGIEPTIYLRSNSLDAAGEVIFPLQAGVSGVSALSKKTFATLQDEPLWLSEYGVVALTSTAITEVTHAKDRGYYVNNDVLDQANTDKAVGFVFENKYYLFVGSNAYIADPRYKYAQKDSYSGSAQYEWFKWTFMNKLVGINGQCLFDDHCYLAADNGIYFLKNDTDANYHQDEINNYYDDTDVAVAWAFDFGEYASGDLVEFNGAFYECILTHNSASDKSPSNATYWALYTTIDGTFAPAYSANGVSYVFGNMVFYGNAYYVCKRYHISIAGKEPGTTLGSQYWVLGSIYTMAYSASAFYHRIMFPIVAYWTTPILNMRDITVRKTLKNLWIRLMKYASMKCIVYYSTQGIVKEQYDGIFDFSSIDFSHLVFSGDTDPSVLVTNRTERKFMSIQFKVESDDANPFGLLEIVGKYTINNTFKG